MDGRGKRATKRQREQMTSRVLLVAAALVLFAGMFMQIAVRAQITAQSKVISEIRREINTLTAEAKNLELCINQHHNPDEIERRALAMGMAQPMEDQLRVVSLPAIYGDTSTQTVANNSGEEING